MLRIKSRNKEFVFDRPVVMGILNVTPDSFSDGGQYNRLDAALFHCETMISQGADIIDIGACSTRPDHAIITESEESERLVPIARAIRKRFPEVLLSVDTFRKNIAEACIIEGIDIINDISGGLFDEAMLPYIGRHHLPYVMMHCVGTAETMHWYQLDGNIHQTVMDFFRQQHKILEPFGEQQIILDPGIGFGKSQTSNFALLSELDKYRFNSYPILIGASRKSFIYNVLKCTSQEADNGTTVVNTLALINGANILRVHNVKNAVEVVKMTLNFKP